MEKKRMSFLLPKSSADRIETIKEAAELSTATDVVRQSLRLYDAMINETLDGATFRIIRKDGSNEAFQPFFMSEKA